MDVDPPLTDGDYKRAASDMPEKLADESAATVIEGLLRRLYELDADDHPAEEAARAYLAQQKELPTPEEVRGILPKPPPGGWPA